LLVLSTWWIWMHSRAASTICFKAAKPFKAWTDRLPELMTSPTCTLGCSGTFCLLHQRSVPDGQIGAALGEFPFGVDDRGRCNISNGHHQRHGLLEPGGVAWWVERFGLQHVECIYRS